MVSVMADGDWFTWYCSTAGATIILFSICSPNYYDKFLTDGWALHLFWEIEQNALEHHPNWPVPTHRVSSTQLKFSQPLDSSKLNVGTRQCDGRSGTVSVCDASPLRVYDPVLTDLETRIEAPPRDRAGRSRPDRPARSRGGANFSRIHSCLQVLMGISRPPDGGDIKLQRTRDVAAETWPTR